MQDILGWIIGICGTMFGIMSSFLNLRRNKSADDKADASEMATITAKLESINNNTLEIKNEIKSIKEETRKNSEQIIRMDESLKSAWRAINKIQDVKCTDEK